MKDTRYDVGELVVEKQTGNLQQIYEIENPESDSPDYMVQSMVNLRDYREMRASELEARENQLPHEKDYIIEIGWRDKNGEEGSFWFRVNAPSTVNSRLGRRLADALESNVDSITGDNLNFWEIGFFEEYQKDDYQDSGQYMGTYTLGDINYLWEFSKRPEVPSTLEYNLMGDGLTPREKDRRV